MSKLALRLIKENKKTRATFLDLSNCGLTEVPEELGDLVWLEDLSFSSDWRVWNKPKKTQNTGPTNNIRSLIPAVSGLNAIKGLLREPVVASNPFSRLLNLKRICLIGDWQSRFELADLSPLAGLVGLQSLDVACTQVADLSPLAGLVGLQSLNVMHTEVTDLSPLARLVGLQTLVVSWTKVTDLSPLAGLVGLQSLDIAHTEVTDLSPLAELTELQILDAGGTQIADLSPLDGLAGCVAKFF